MRKCEAEKNRQVELQNERRTVVIMSVTENH